MAATSLRTTSNWPPAPAHAGVHTIRKPSATGPDQRLRPNLVVFEKQAHGISRPGDPLVTIQSDGGVNLNEGAAKLLCGGDFPEELSVGIAYDSDAHALVIWRCPKGEGYYSTARQTHGHRFACHRAVQDSGLLGGTTRRWLSTIDPRDGCMVVDLSAPSEEVGRFRTKTKR